MIRRISSAKIGLGRMETRPNPSRQRRFSGPNSVLLNPRLVVDNPNHRHPTENYSPDTHARVARDASDTRLGLQACSEASKQSAWSATSLRMQVQLSKGVAQKARSAHRRVHDVVELGIATTHVIQLCLPPEMLALQIVVLSGIPLVSLTRPTLSRTAD